MLSWMLAASAIPSALLLFGASLLLPPNFSHLRSEASLELYSREGNLLKEYHRNASRQERLSLAEYPDFLPELVLFAEDERFYFHPGIDPLAVARAAWQNLTEMKLVSGASTITQQLARMRFASAMPASLWGRKLVEMYYSLYLEIHFSKKEILTAYLNGAPMPGNIRGFGAAAQGILDKDVRYLSIREAIALVILLRGHDVTKEKFLSRYKQLASRWRQHWQKRLEGVGQDKRRLWQLHSTRDNLTQELDSLTDKIYSSSLVRAGSSGQGSDSAEHFVAWLKERYPRLNGKVRTTLSHQLNSRIRKILLNELQFLRRKNVRNGAVVVLKLPQASMESPPRAVAEGSLELVAMVGSKNFWDPNRGQVNGALSYRSAGSTLKPFVYSLAMDELKLKPYDMVQDSPVTIPLPSGESYSPRNNDLAFWGDLTLHEALANSRNVPAVWLAHQVGVDKLYHYFKKLKLGRLARSMDYYGPGLALGIGSVTLLDLTRAYASIAKGGRMLPLRLGRDGGGRRISYGRLKKSMNADTAARLTYILADRDLRRRAFGERNFLDFPFEVAAKTGTSKDHIDSWTVGFTENYAVGVWLGNFSGQGMYGVSGNWGAGRVFHQVMRLVADPNHRFDYPDNWRGVELCRDSGRPVATNPGCRSYVELAAPGDLQRWGGAFSVSFASVDSSDSVFSPREDGEKPHNSTRGTQGLMRSGIISPAPGERFIYDETLAIEQKIPLRISTADLVGELSYRINDGPKRAIQSDVDRGLRLGNGSHKVTLYQGSEVIDRVWFFVEGGR